jgi:LuxR family maltose regulon positive regulatory protein
MHTVSGELVRAGKTAQLAETVSKKINLAYMHGWSLYLQACNHFRSHDLEAASSLFAHVVEKRYVTHTRIVIDSLAGLALVYQAMQRSDAAMETSKQLLEFALDTEDPGHVSVAHSTLARISLAQGDLKSADRWVRSFNEVQLAPAMFIWLENPSITQVRVWVAIGSEETLRKATEFLQALRLTAEALHNTCQTIEIRVLQSLALEKQGRADAALAVLKEALALAGPRGWIQPFVEPGPPMAELLIRLSKKNVELDYIRRILAAIRRKERVPTQGVADKQTVRPSPSSSQFPEDPLSRRETEVLSFLCKGMSNKEIASNLFISDETVRKHLYNIYQKLHVSKRGHAIRKAMEMGIISSS